MKRLIDAAQCVQRVHQLRRAGHTVESIGALSGLPVPVVAGLEVGPRLVPVDTHNKIMRLGVPAAETRADDVPCTADPDLWFSDDPHQRAVAQRMCRGCLLRDECAELGRHESWGIWGGLRAVAPNGAHPNQNRQRRTDLAELLRAGETFESAAARMGMNVPALERWCYRHAPDLVPGKAAA